MNTLDAYYDFLGTKRKSSQHRGLQQIPDLNDAMFGFQRDSTEYLLSCGSGAALLDTGMGKSFIELEWSRVIAQETGKPVIFFAPLAVGRQHIQEASRWGIDARLVRDQEEIRQGINITNYERLHRFNPHGFGGIVLDESSILKGYTGKTSRALMSFAEHIPYRLAATATPAPNDHMELGQHSQFLGQMESNEMLARWFIADQSEMGRYRLKRYGVDSFWSWVASWSRMATKPSDLGHSDEGFNLPELRTTHHEVKVDLSANADGALFRIPDTSATAIHKEKRLTSSDRSDCITDLVASDPGEPWVVWCETDYEADDLMERIPDAVEVRGSMRLDEKERRLVDFGEGRIRVLVTKPSIAGFGLNWQHCARCAFVGLSFSYESYYQAIRRFWRFGQKRPVDVHIAQAETEGAIWNAIRRKANDHDLMKKEMVKAMRRACEMHDVKLQYQPTEIARIPSWVRAA